MTRHSLRLRLLIGGAAVIGLTLIIAGFALTYLFERHVERSLANQLNADLKQVLSVVELDPAGRPRLRREPSDPRFADPLSGLYWQLSTDAGALTRSRSLWDATLPLPRDALSQGDVHEHRIAGPAGQELLAVERTVRFNRANEVIPVRVVIAANVSNIIASRQAFSRDLVPALILLGLTLATATWVQINLGLRPLVRVRSGISDVRSGQASALDRDAPSEVQPLVDEINELLAAQERDLARARGRAADLAHGLKTPLSALAADIRTLKERGEETIAGQIEEVAETIRRHVERELARTRIRGARLGGLVTQTELLPLVEKLTGILKRTESGKRLCFKATVAPGTTMPMEKTDLAEVLGNLLENAARYARTQIRIEMVGDGRVAIDDDGPGIPEAMKAAVLVRGQRLDQSSGGTGLGLAIVQEVLEAYGRQLKLESSSLGGLRVVF
ncbi:periplasmic sensor signal transduction histidine kinase [Hyphomicrobium denitrificans 1NES1]|uniref:histidine kinase n=1 Tax=Hyphomicrobium denitrificans 1NES1 TaxID=670307 RepID=N0B7P9_9HYPH|nr:ATP-binding protein [Hyphomicrobium denitrificans]AGK56546.1 periplasmic sensor signal transduction histidine kinase [Hyphomicrobium denitrificans 1NES1]